MRNGTTFVLKKKNVFHHLNVPWFCKGRLLNEGIIIQILGNVFQLATAPGNSIRLAWTKLTWRRGHCLCPPFIAQGRGIGEFTLFCGCRGYQMCSDHFMNNKARFLPGCASGHIFYTHPSLDTWCLKGNAVSFTTFADDHYTSIKYQLF